VNSIPRLLSRLVSANISTYLVVYSIGQDEMPCS
jgi:hypothetical protein